MCELAKTLLAEKLIDDFYEGDRQPHNRLDAVNNELTEHLKCLLPEDKWNLLFLWESQTVEEGGKELRRFADFVARLLLGCTESGFVLADSVSAIGDEEE